MRAGGESERMSEGFSAVDVDDVDRDFNDRAGAWNANLIAALGCEKLHPRVWYLSPGDEMSYHRHVEQEEFYYVVAGPGRMRIDGEVVDVPTGGAVRVSPALPRQLVNHTTDREHVWLVVASPAATNDGVHL